jgi:putative DNA primase/helicase
MYNKNDDTVTTNLSLMTLLTRCDNKVLHSKHYGYSNGEMVKHKHYIPAITNARIVAYTLQQLAEIIKTDVVVIMGSPQGITAKTNMTLLSRAAFKYYFPQHKNPPFVATLNGDIGSTRTLDTYIKNPTATLDYDATAATPEHLRFDTHEKLMNYLAQTVHPDFAKISYTASYSSSAGLYAPDGTMLRDLTRMHVYFNVDDAQQMTRFKTFLEAKLVVNDGFWTETNKKGYEVVKLVLDVPVISAERYIFETKLKLSNGLYQIKPEAFYHQGELECFDTRNLPEIEPAQVKKIAKVYQLPENAVTTVRSVTGIKRDFDTLQFDTDITLVNGETMTCEQIESKLKSGFENSIPCHSPFREDAHPSCFLALTSRKQIFLHDSAEKISYFCKPKPLPVQPFNVPLPDDIFVDMRGKLPLVTRLNIDILLKNYGCSVKYNQMNKLTDYNLPNVQAVSMDNAQTVCLSKIQDLCVRNGMTAEKQRLTNVLLEIADEHRYHPIKDWILSQQWDGIDRLSLLLDTLTVSSEYAEFKAIVIPKVLSAIVHHAFNEHGVKFENVLVLSGEQGIGKSSWFVKLLPKGMVLDGHKLDIKDKDKITTAVSHALVELGELDQTFKSSTVSELKAFFSKDKDVVRLPYAARDSHFPRRTVFVGSVNKTQFLKDMTGNRRYWVLETLAVNYQHNIDMQQVFAQVYEQFYLVNAPLHLTPAEELIQKSLVIYHEEPEPLLEMLLQAFDFSQPDHLRVPMSSSQILQLLGLPLEQGNMTKLGIILTRQLSITSKNAKGHVKNYLMPQA